MGGPRAVVRLTREMMSKCSQAGWPTKNGVAWLWREEQLMAAWPNPWWRRRMRPCRGVCGGGVDPHRRIGLRAGCAMPREATSCGDRNGAMRPHRWSIVGVCPGCHLNWEAKASMASRAAVGLKTVLTTGCFSHVASSAEPLHGRVTHGWFWWWFGDRDGEKSKRNRRGMGGDAGEGCARVAIERG